MVYDDEMCGRVINDDDEEGGWGAVGSDECVEYAVCVGRVVATRHNNVERVANLWCC